MKYPSIQNFINGKFVSASTTKTMDVISPLNGSHLSTIPMSAYKDLDDEIKSSVEDETYDFLSPRKI